MRESENGAHIAGPGDTFAGPGAGGPGRGPGAAALSDPWFSAAYGPMTAAWARFVCFLSDGYYPEVDGEVFRMLSTVAKAFRKLAAPAPRWVIVNLLASAERLRIRPHRDTREFLTTLQERAAASRVLERLGCDLTRAPCDLTRWRRSFRPRAAADGLAPQAPI